VGALDRIASGAALKALYGPPERDHRVRPSVYGIDPGPVMSAIVELEPDGRVAWSAKLANELLLADMHAFNGTIAIEKVVSYGMAVGAEVFETVFWSGRFMQAAAQPEKVLRVPRLDVKLHLCHNPRANDANIRAAIIDRYGGKDAAIGLKKTPGPLHGISADRWAALAVALVVSDRMQTA
jgi:hypothetical protein